MSDLFQDQFTEMWQIYPHYATRSKRADCKVLWGAITTKGIITKIEGTDLKRTVLATPEEIIIGAKAACMMTSDSGMSYVQGCQVWMRRAGWEDFEDAEELAARYDARQIEAEQRANTTVVNPGPNRGSRLRVVD